MVRAAEGHAPSLPLSLHGRTAPAASPLSPDCFHSPDALLPCVCGSGPGSRFSPPRCLHCPYYPALGPYSSRDPAIIRRHLVDLEEAGVDVMVGGD